MFVDQALMDRGHSDPRSQLGGDVIPVHVDAGQVTCRKPLSTNAGNHAWARTRQSASVSAGGPPGTRPSAATGPRYLRTVLRSRPKLSAI